MQIKQLILERNELGFTPVRRELKFIGKELSDKLKNRRLNRDSQIDRNVRVGTEVKCKRIY